MKSYNITLLLILVALTSLTLCMDPEQPNSIIERSEGKASDDLRQRLSYVKDLFVKRDLIEEDKQIHLGYLNSAALQELAQKGCSIKYNALTNGTDSILVERHLEDLPQDQQESAIAHELAHIAIRNKSAYLNPHNWLESARLGSAEIARWIGMPLIVISVIGNQEHKPMSAWRKKCAHTGLSCLGLALGNTLVLPLFLDAHDTYDHNQPIEYRIMHKTEEMMCDLIAATVLPDGGRKGAELYRTKLLHNGNRNGHKADHPYTATRIWYHEKIDHLQKMIQKY